jgi:DNA-binding beta-propeller fold protein YncE
LARRYSILAAVLAAGLAGCGSGSVAPNRTTPPVTTSSTTATKPAATPKPQPTPKRSHDDLNIYAAAAANMFSPAVAGDLALVYVPNSNSNTVDVISQQTKTIVAHYAVGTQPQHVTPSWDLRTLWVDNDLGNSLTPIDPRTGRPRGAPVPVRDPYNMYFTPDGRYAIVVAERLERLDFRDPQTMALRHSLAVPGCAGVDHMDFSADGRYAYASCEFAGAMIRVDLSNQRVVGRILLHQGRSQPQDVKLSPNGRALYVADQLAGGVWELTPASFRVRRLLPTGVGPHGLYPSRDARVMYVTNRAEGSISVVDFARGVVIAKWRLPPPASPDMGGVSADGSVLWLSGRYNAEVYAISTRDGRLIKRIKVGEGPHGLSVWPQPGRYSLGHTGITR